MRAAKKAGARERIDELVGHAVISNLFDLIEIADEEITRAGFKRGEPAPLRHTCPRPWFRDAPRDLYRAHAREIALRARKGEDLVPATAAEVLWACSRTSLLAPLRHDACLIMEHCFIEVYGVKVAERTLRFLRENSQEAVREIRRNYQEAQHELRDATRKWDGT